MEQEVTKVENALLKEGYNRDKLVTLFSSPGWRLIEDFLQNKYNIAIENLKKDKDAVNARALIHIIDSLINEMGLAIQVGNQAREQLSQLK
ncbi:MAG: hypothetical protein E3J83_03470 [Candidatus Atribacteria bacterium]|nr:MAG: hypothetical protein E3J83_03470 [Candidatus Atribacteria bacterium]